jgi:hypothetical protein
MFSHVLNAPKSTLTNLSSVLSLILRNKMTIAIFALLAITESVAAKNVILHLECGSFDMKKNEDAVSALSIYSKPARFSAVFDNEAFERECFVTSEMVQKHDDLVMCNPSKTFDEADYLQVTTEDASVCDGFNQLARENRIMPGKFLTDESKSEAKLNVNSIIAGTKKDPLAGKNIILHLECGSFEMKKNDEIVPTLSILSEPVQFSAVFENEDVERECITVPSKDSKAIAYCSPPQKFKDEEYVQLTRESDSICDSFNRLVKDNKVNPSKFFTDKSQKKANYNMYAVLAEEVITAQGYADNSFQAKRSKTR